MILQFARRLRFDDLINDRAAVNIEGDLGGRVNRIGPHSHAMVLPVHP